MSDKPAIIHYTAKTPNGSATSVFLEALKAAYPDNPDLQSYETVKLSISDADIGKVHNQVKSPWFLEINPNGRIPAATIHGFNVFETSAILLYLADLYDKKRIFSYDPVKEPKEYSEQLQWIFFAHGGIGPMQGQANHFKFAAPEKIEYGQKRYINETKRLYGVLEGQLKKGDKKFILGDKFSLADLKTFPWVRRSDILGIDLGAEFPTIKAWIDRIEARKDVQDGLNIPA
ncbi:glutathione S-transferase [Gymnopilus junonius]|uniref:Glutathione S-transferase n=1 Tax=Gymnopilus junonius TaxID=109634 RepID=A0A9P5NHZ1_GYMJU|nr:glutathione S-transferase [Gymnopilus junonius]